VLNFVHTLSHLFAGDLKRLSDPKQAYYANEAREFLRKKLIGKHVKVTIDFIRPREGEFDERECATIKYGNQNAYADKLDSFIPG